MLLRLSPVVEKGGYSLVVVEGFLIALTCLVVEHRLWEGGGGRPASKVMRFLGSRAQTHLVAPLQGAVGGGGAGNK